MTPICSTPNHEDNKQSSTVFHRDEPGKVVAKFFGSDHRSDANEFVAEAIEPSPVGSPAPDDWPAAFARWWAMAPVDQREAAIRAIGGDPVSEWTWQVHPKHAMDPPQADR